MKTRFIYLFLLITLISSCQPMIEKYKWIPTSSAPELYPMEIYNGHLFLEDDNSVYIPASAINNPGWGYSGPFHSQGEDLKALPIRLEVTWASFLENKFYEGSWDLPLDKFKALFKEGTTAWRNNKPSNYSEIVVGLAPGGVAVVWVYGDDQQIEIGRFQAKETKVAMKDFVPENPEITQKEYFNVSESVPQAYENMKKNGIQYGLWDTYRKKYQWRTRVEIPNNTFERINIETFNGEEETLFDGVDRQNEFKLRAIPRLLSFSFKNKKNVQTIFQVKYFDEEEIFELFNKVDQTKPIEIILRMNEDFSNRSLIFKQEDKEFPIKKVDFDNMWKYEN